MTYEYAQAHKKEIDARILRDAEPIPSVEELPKFLREHGRSCVCVVDGKIAKCWPLDYLDLKRTTPERYAEQTTINGETLAALIKAGRIRACMAPM